MLLLIKRLKKSNISQRQRVLTSLTQSAEKLNTQSKTVNNAIITLGDTDDSGKGKLFKSRFIQPGIAGYPEKFGTALIRKESLDKFIYSLRGKYVIINHKDVINEEDKVGEVYDVWFNPEDGWYWCNGVIWDETAQNLITDKGWSVSCSYNVKLADDAGGTENNIPYDIEFLDGVFTHLAIVDNPRYERANIVFNSKTVVKNATEDAQGNLHSENNGQFVSKGGVNPNYKEELKQVIEKAKNNPNERQKLIIGKVSKDLEKKAKENGFDIAGYEHDLDVSGTRHTLKTHGNEKKENARGQIAITDEDFEKIPDVVYRPDNITFGETDGKNTPLIRYSKRFDDGTVIYVEEIRTRQKTLTIKSMWKQKNNADNSCTFTDFNPQRLEYISNIIITDIQEDFNPDINKVHNNKEQDMALIDELKKLITKVENEKPEGENMDDDKKIENEKVDKRKLIDEVAGIMKSAGADDEKIRTAIGKMEKLAYDKSEAGTADNEKKDDKPADASKVENEETKKDEEKYKELKKDVKEDVKNECKNSVDNAKGGYFDKMNEVYNSPTKVKKENTYISRAQKLKDAEAYFGKESFKLFSSFFYSFVVIPFR